MTTPLSSISKVCTSNLLFFSQFVSKFDRKIADFSRVPLKMEFLPPGPLDILWIKFVFKYNVLRAARVPPPLRPPPPPV